MSDALEIDILRRLIEGHDLDRDDLLSSINTSSDDEVLLNIIVGGIYPAIMTYATPHYRKERYHTSALTGTAWVEELMDGHPDRICCELGVRLPVFEKLLRILQKLGHSDSKHVPLHEQLAIFLYTCVTGLTTRHVGERFQRSNGTISQ